MDTNFVFHQMFEPETSTYTYLLADKEKKEAVLIDPVLEKVDRDLQLIEEYGFKLLYVLDTHIHADHITGAGEIRKRTGAKNGVSFRAQVSCVDMNLHEGEEIRFGRYKIRVLETPGHTDSCLSFYCEGRIFTGDALLIRGNGRTDFQQGSAEKLYESIAKKIFSLPEETIVYPAHDYRGHTSSSIAMEKQYNQRLGGHRSKDEFVKIMADLKLAQPKKIHEAVPANMACGVQRKSQILSPSGNDGIPEISAQAVKESLGKVHIVDVRRPDEFNGELGHIQGAELVPLGQDLENYLKQKDRSQEIIFVCRSGGRSGQATSLSLKMGFLHTMNMQGGMLQWNDHKFPVVRGA